MEATGSEFVFCAPAGLWRGLRLGIQEDKVLPSVEQEKVDLGESLDVFV